MLETLYDFLPSDFQKAIQLLELKRFKDAMPIFKNCLGRSIFPDICLQYLFECSLHLDNKKDALLYSNLALSKYPNNAECVILKAIYENNYGTSENALRYADYTLKINPEHLIAHKIASLVYILNNQFEKAQPHINSLKRISPNSFESFYVQGLNYLIQGKEKEGKTILKQALQFFPEDQDLKSMFIQLSLIDKKEIDSLEEMAIENLSINPEDQLARATLLDILKNKNFLLRFFSGNSFNRYQIKWSFWRVVLVIVFWKGALIWAGFALLYLLINWVGGVLYNSTIRLNSKYKLLLSKSDIQQSNVLILLSISLLIILMTIIQWNHSFENIFAFSCLSLMVLMLSISLFEIKTKKGKKHFFIYTFFVAFILFLFLKEPLILGFLSILLLLFYAFLFTLNISFR